MVEVRTANQLEDLRELLMLGGDVNIAVAYVRESGLREIEEQLLAAREKGTVRFLFSLDGRVTEPAAAERLLGLVGQGFEVKYFEIPASERAIFHPKLYISSSGLSVTFLTGSYNLTGAALGRNKEHGLKVICTGIERPGQDALASFNALWDDNLSKPLTREKVADYAVQYIHPTKTPNDELWADQRYWLFKCNPPRHNYSFSDFVNDGIADWGIHVRNSTSRGWLRDEVRIGDKILFYHTGHRVPNVPTTAIVGTAQVVWRNGDPNAPLVRILHEQTFIEPVTLAQIVAGGRGAALHNLGQMMSNTHTRYTVQPVTPLEFAEIVRMGMGENQP